jgi:hypothetical protein
VVETLRRGIVDMQQALKARHAIIHVMGPQCGESAEQIIDRKCQDFTLRRSQKTLWAHHSRLASVGMVRKLGEGGDAHLFLVADSVGNAKRIKMPGQQTTSPFRPAKEYSPRDRHPGHWRPIAELNISPVTDSSRFLDHENGWALVLGDLKSLVDSPVEICMEDWADVSECLISGTGNPVPLRTGLGFHAVCAERTDMRSHNAVWRKRRVIIGVAPLVPPYAVWLR